jgi:hypothetical protein
MDEPLTGASCLFCRAQVWATQEGRLANGRVLTFDLVGEGEDRMLFVHDCEADEEDFDEPEYGCYPNPFEQEGPESA